MKQMDLFKLPPMTFPEMMADLAKREPTVEIIDWGNHQPEDESCEGLCQCGHGHDDHIEDGACIRCCDCTRFYQIESN